MSHLTVYGIEPQTESFRQDVLRGFRQPQKELPSKYFYDARGSCLFDRICKLDEYYLTRTEFSIMRRFVGEIAARLGRRCLIVEYGSGNGLKTRYLLDHLIEPAAYVPIDISKNALVQSAETLAARFPALEVVPVCADFTGGFKLPSISVAVARTVVYFPGSTIGNFRPSEATRLLKQIVTQCGEGGALLIGVDLRKDRATLERAYNDRAGVTEAFNLNLLRRINRELGANFRLDRFSHKAFYNHQLGCIEMHLVSREAQVVTIDDVEIAFERGETICTEHSYKYSIDEFHALAEPAGLDPEAVWTDERNFFAVLLLKIR